MRAVSDRELSSEALSPEEETRISTEKVMCMFEHGVLLFGPSTHVISSFLFAYSQLVSILQPPGMLCPYWTVWSRGPKM